MLIADVRERGLSFVPGNLGGAREKPWDIVFVHGVNSTSRSCWASGDTFWPTIAAEDIPEANVWTLGYEVDAFPTGSSRTVPLYDCANRCLLAIATLQNCNRLVLVGHSFGGLVIKKLLCSAKLSLRGSWLLSKVVGIVFVATPHAGSSLASWLRYIGLGTVTTDELVLNNSMLRELHTTFAELVAERMLASTAFGETRRYKGVLVVPTESADPQLPYGKFISLVGEDHSSIAKPKNVNHPVQAGLKGFLVDIESCDYKRRTSSAQTTVVAQSSFLYLLDHHFLKAAGIDPDGIPPEPLARILNAAVKVSLLVGEALIVSAVSLAQSRLCRYILKDLDLLIELGLIKQVIDTPTFEEFIEARIREYPRGSPESITYEHLAADPSIRWISCISTGQNTTSTLHKAWSGDWERFYLGRGTSLAQSGVSLQKLEQAWAEIPRRLNDAAFIARNVLPHMPLQLGRNGEAVLAEYISELFFDSLIKALPGSSAIVVDIPNVPKLQQPITATPVSYFRVLSSVYESDAALYRMFRAAPLVAALEYRRHPIMINSVKAALL